MLVCICSTILTPPLCPTPLQVRDVSARFLDKLQRRQRESAVVRNISDIILDFVSGRGYIAMVALVVPKYRGLYMVQCRKWQIMALTKFWYNLKGLFLSLQKIIKFLRLDQYYSCYICWKIFTCNPTSLLYPHDYCGYMYIKWSYHHCLHSPATILNATSSTAPTKYTRPGRCRSVCESL